jgi:hypothetical protein
MIDQEYKVGQELWFASSKKYRSSCMVTIIAVGRKWLKLHNGLRADKVTFEVDGGQYLSPGKLYATKEEWDAKCERGKAWGELWQKITDMSVRRPPLFATAEAIRAADRLLFPEIEPNKEQEK